MRIKPNQFPMRAVPGYYSSMEGIQIGFQTNADASDEDLQFYQQLGVEWAMVGINSAEQHSLDFYKRLVKRFAEYGIKIYRLTNLSVHNVEEITLNLPGRDKKVEDRYNFVTPDMQEKHGITHKIVTYTEQELEKLLKSVGYTDVNVTRSAFGNIKATAYKPAALAEKPKSKKRS